MKSFISYFALLIIFTIAPLFAQEEVSLSYEALDGKIIIKYELIGDDEKEYEVELSLRRESDKSFNYKPSTISGDVGKGKFASGKKEIVWTLTSKENQLFAEGEDYFFELGAVEVKRGGLSWVYYVGGAVLAGGGAALLLLKPKTTATTETLPTPPGRP